MPKYLRLNTLIAASSLVGLAFSCGSEPSFLAKTSTSARPVQAVGSPGSPGGDSTVGTVGGGAAGSAGAAASANAVPNNGGAVASVPGSDSTVGDEVGQDGSSPGATGTTAASGTGTTTAGAPTTGTAATGSTATGTTTGATGTTTAGTATGTTRAGTSTGATTTTSTTPNIPGAAAGDLGTIADCLAQWPQNPFTGVVQNYEKIDAAVTVFGVGNAINDTDTTPEPELILIDTGVNVFGTPVYNFLNNNGWYCMKVNVNVETNLTVNLSCSAHLADSRVGVNVLSNQNNATSTVGVSVLSDVDVVTVRPDGVTCIR